MFSNSIKLFKISKCVRAYSSNAKPIKMAYEIYQGKNVQESTPPLIIMHGLFGSKQNFRGVCRNLESKTDRKIIAVDARNHGNSPHSSEHSSLHMSLDIIELMNDMNIKKTSVMGHSMGGRTMMYLALKYPEYVDRGVIVDISPISVPRDFSEMEEIFLAMKALNVPSTLSMGEGRKFAEKELKNAVSQKETIDFILLNLKKKQDGSFTWAVNVDAIHSNLSHFDNFMEKVVQFEPYTGPMTFICGNRSNFVDPDSWPEIQKLFPNSEIHWLDAGHLVHFDQPAQFVDLVVNFLNKK